jgi:hypothetical protein
VTLARAVCPSRRSTVGPRKFPLKPLVRERTPAENRVKPDCALRENAAPAEAVSINGGIGSKTLDLVAQHAGAANITEVPRNAPPCRRNVRRESISAVYQRGRCLRCTHKHLGERADGVARSQVGSMRRKSPLSPHSAHAPGAGHGSPRLLNGTGQVHTTVAQAVGNPARTAEIRRFW